MDAADILGAPSRSTFQPRSRPVSESASKGLKGLNREVFALTGGASTGDVAPTSPTQPSFKTKRKGPSKQVCWCLLLLCLLWYTADLLRRCCQGRKVGNLVMSGARLSLLSSWSRQLLVAAWFWGYAPLVFYSRERSLCEIKWRKKVPVFFDTHIPVRNDGIFFLNSSFLEE